MSDEIRGLPSKVKVRDELEQSLHVRSISCATSTVQSQTEYIITAIPIS